MKSLWFFHLTLNLALVLQSYSFLVMWQIEEGIGITNFVQYMVKIAWLCETEA